MTVARRKQIDAARHRRTTEEAADHLRFLAELAAAAADDRREIPDDRLALMFTCAHPAIDAAIRAPLILQTILGFDAATIASAFLVSPTTMGQRLVRAKSKIKLAGIPFRVPDRADLRDRLDAVLEAIYAAYAEGWSDPAGTEARRRNLAEEAIWLGRLVASLLPEEPEGLGLLALMLHAQARRAARRDARDGYVPLADQDPRCGTRLSSRRPRRFFSWPAPKARSAGTSWKPPFSPLTSSDGEPARADWQAIERLYDALLALTGSPVVAINRAVAVAHTRGPKEGLSLLDGLSGDERLMEYQPYWAARAGLLARLGRRGGRPAYQRATGLERDPAVRRFLQQRRTELRAPYGHKVGEP